MQSDQSTAASHHVFQAGIVSPLQSRYNSHRNLSRTGCQSHALPAQSHTRTEALPPFSSSRLRAAKSTGLQAAGPIRHKPLASGSPQAAKWQTLRHYIISE